MSLSTATLFLFILIAPAFFCFWGASLVGKINREQITSSTTMEICLLVTVSTILHCTALMLYNYSISLIRPGFAMAVLDVILSSPEQSHQARGKLIREYSFYLAVYPIFVSILAIVAGYAAMKFIQSSALPTAGSSGATAWIVAGQPEPTVLATVMTTTIVNESILYFHGNLQEIRFGSGGILQSIALKSAVKFLGTPDGSFPKRTCMVEVSNITAASEIEGSFVDKEIDSILLIKGESILNVFFSKIQAAEKRMDFTFSMGKRIGLPEIILRERRKHSKIRSS